MSFKGEMGKKVIVFRKKHTRETAFLKLIENVSIFLAILLPKWHIITYKIL